MRPSDGARKLVRLLEKGLRNWFSVAFGLVSAEAASSDLGSGGAGVELNGGGREGGHFQNGAARLR